MHANDFENSGNRPLRSEVPPILSRLRLGRLACAESAVVAIGAITEAVANTDGYALGSSIYLGGIVAGKALFDAHGHWVNGDHTVTNTFVRRWTADSQD